MPQIEKAAASVIILVLAADRLNWGVYHPANVYFADVWLADGKTGTQLLIPLQDEKGRVAIVRFGRADDGCA